MQRLFQIGARREAAILKEWTNRDGASNLCLFACLLLQAIRSAIQQYRHIGLGRLQVLRCSVERSKRGSVRASDSRALVHPRKEREGRPATLAFAVTVRLRPTSKGGLSQN